MAQHTVAAWHIEHANHERLLDFLDAQLAALRTGGPPHYPLMLDVTSYLAHFCHRYHHAREEVAFQYVLDAEAVLHTRIDRLIEEHRGMTSLAADLRGLLLKGPGYRTQIEASLSSYSTLFRRHIMAEEEEIMPRAAALLKAATWQSVACAAPPGPDPFQNYHRRRHNPTFGSEAENRYRELSRRISAFVPPPRVDTHASATQPNLVASTRALGIPRVSKAPDRNASYRRVLARQSTMLLALVASYLQFYFLDVELRILRLPALLVYLFK